MDEKLIDLIQRAQSGDRQAFGEIYKLYVQKIYRYCLINVKRKEVAEDICQETFVKAWKSLSSFSIINGGTIQSFLFTIARNLIIDLSRKKKEHSIDEYEHIESTEDIFDTVEKNESIQRVHFAISKLDEIDRQIVILRYFEEMSTQEVAQIVGIKDGALRVRIHRVMSKLKDIMEAYYDRRTN